MQASELRPFLIWNMEFVADTIGLDHNLDLTIASIEPKILQNPVQ